VGKEERCGSCFALVTATRSDDVLAEMWEGKAGSLLESHAWLNTVVNNQSSVNYSNIDEIYSRWKFEGNEQMH
jgi:hypothetical protein